MGSKKRFRTGKKVLYNTIYHFTQSGVNKFWRKNDSTLIAIYRKSINQGIKSSTKVLKFKLCVPLTELMPNTQLHTSFNKWQTKLGILKYLGISTHKKSRVTMKIKENQLKRK